MRVKIEQDEEKTVNKPEGKEVKYKAVGKRTENDLCVVITSDQPLNLQEGDEIEIKKVAGQTKMK